MPAMGRHRVSDLDLPPRMRLKHGGYYFDSYAKGKPRKWIFLGHDIRAARAAWAILVNAVDSDTFAALHDKYISECMDGLSAGTQSNYTYAGEVLRKAFGHMKLAEITPQHVAQYLDSHASKTSANNQIMLMGVMFEKAMRWGWTTMNPCRGVRRNKVKARDVYVTDSDFINVRAKAAPWAAAAMNIAYVTSLRSSDVLKIMLSDIRDDGLHVVHKKTGKRQIFDMAGGVKIAIEEARALPRKIGSMFLIAGDDGQPFKPNGLQRALRNAAAKACVPSFHFHDIRAKAATDAERDGEDYFRLLGHADRAMSDKYVKARKVDRVKSGREIL